MVAIDVTYTITRDWPAARAVSLIKPVVQTVAFPIHEGIWIRIDANVRKITFHPRIECPPLG
ncbi:MAG: DUF2061 domain-containing protein [Caulobacteraceae bacterium]|nr:DUF2061 domain-containing protein [Caulobacteraceae bacterium]